VNDDQLPRDGCGDTSEYSPHRGPCYWGKHANADALLSWLINRDLELMPGDSYWDEKRKVVLVATGELFPPFAVRSDADVLTMMIGPGPHGSMHVVFKGAGKPIVGTFVDDETASLLLAARRLLIESKGERT
jgi:hypothetical protein